MSSPPPEETSSPESSPDNVPALDLLHVSDSSARAGDSDVSNEEDKVSEDKNRFVNFSLNAIDLVKIAFVKSEELTK